LDESGVCDRIIDEHCALFAYYEPGCEACHEWFNIYDFYIAEADAFISSVLEELGTTAEEVFEAAQRRRGRDERVQHMLERLQTAADFEGFCGIMRERYDVLQMLYGPAGAPQHNGEWDRASPDPIETGSPLGSPSHD
jgi:hypothetical protein